MKTLAIRSDFDFKFSGFRALFLGFRVLKGLLFWEIKNLNPTEGFEHVKGYAGFAAGKPRVCSEHLVYNFQKNMNIGILVTIENMLIPMDFP